ncbi:FAD-dependent monooxygenase [Paenibacillus sp. HJGM_3]|uniref:FAD-dependent monooxygenase n=1 Tax=Paenibacillus sp. HJGM_3 TaxID=3379816 RepID=UPI00385FEBAA
MDQRKRFLIIGGGIAGLTTAIALRQQGFEAEVYEAAPELKEAGAGLGVGSNALKAMRVLGLEEKLLERSLILSSATFIDDKGHLITRTDSAPADGGLDPDNVIIHRTELLHLLADALPPEAIKTNKKCLGFAELDHGGVAVRFEDGSTAEADGLIAADGIHSGIRLRVQPNAVPRYAGYTCWRAVVEGPQGGIDPVFMAIWGSRGRFGYAPLPGNRVYWFAVLNSMPSNPAYMYFDTRDLGLRFAGYPAPVGELLERTENSVVLHNDIYDLKPLSRFAYGAVVLVGDAAHATTPNLAQGAAQAMEDAVVLARCLADGQPTVQEAFRRFEQLRLARTRRVVALSRRLGRMAQLESQLMCSLRNRLLRAMPARLAGRQLQFLRDVPF